MRKLLILIVTMVVSSEHLYAQQFTTPSQYMLNNAYLNPAYSGDGALYSFTALYRSQWTGYKDYEDNASAPSMQLFTGLINVNQTGHTLGFIFSNDKAAYVSNTQGQVSYAYRINVSEKSTLALGFRGGLFSQTVNFDKYVIKHPDDPVIPQQKQTEIHPDMTVALWLEHEKYYLGLSSKGVLTKDNYLTPGFRNETAYIGTVGYHVVRGYNWRLTPSVQVISTAKNFLIDGSLMVNAKDVFWTGVCYRHQQSISAILGVGLLEKKLRVSYACDYTTNNEKVTAGTSHELMLNYNIGRFQKRKHNEEAQKQENSYR